MRFAEMSFRGTDVSDEMLQEKSERVRRNYGYVSEQEEHAEWGLRGALSGDYNRIEGISAKPHFLVFWLNKPCAFWNDYSLIFVFELDSLLWTTHIMEYFSDEGNRLN